MAWIIFTSCEEAESFQVATDVPLGYPESIESLRYVGVGIHAPKELGRAMHYAEHCCNKVGNCWALPFTDAVVKPVTATKVDKLPDDWWPVVAMEAQVTEVMKVK